MTDPDMPPRAETLAQARQAFLDALAEGESDPMAEAEGISPYFILVGGGSFEGMPCDDSGFPVWHGWRGPLGDWPVSHAAGRYQFQPATWHGQATALNLADFGPDSQDAAAWALAENVYNLRTGRSLKLDLLSDTLGSVASALQSTWTSLSSATFPSRYHAALRRSGPRTAPEAPPDVATAADPVPAPPAPPDAEPAYLARVLLLEDPEAELIQIGLAAKGLYRGAIDGIIGPRSRAALEAWRKRG